LIVLLSFICVAVLDGTMYSFGHLLEPIANEMNQTRSTIAISGSLQVALSAFIAPLAAKLVEKKGSRVSCHAGALTSSFGLLLASFSSNIFGIFGGLSLLGGIGFGLMYIPAVVSVAESFSERRSFAVGLTLCGAGAGQVLVAPLVGWIVQGWGWRRALQGLSCLALTCAGCGFFMGEKGIREGEQLDLEEDLENEDRYSCLTAILGSKIASSEHVWVFLVAVLGDILAVMSLYIPYSFLQPVVLAAEVDSTLANLLIPAIGVGSVLGRLFSGWLSDQPWCHPLFLTRSVLLMASVLPFLISWVDRFWMFVGLALLFGFLTGQWIAATTPLLVSLLGLEQLSQAFGLLTALRGLASLVSPPLAGLLLDLTTNISIPLYLSGSFLLLSGGIYSFSVLLLKRSCNIESVYEKI